VSDSETPERREVYYQGRVQGVGFRYTTRALAGRFRVAGYVKNLWDGRVVVVAEGAPQELVRFFAAIDDHLGHYVAEVREETPAATGEFGGFDIRF
jgi:acylphosphatase